MFVVTAQPHAHVRFRRAIERRALWLAEDAARDLPNLSLPDALQLVHLYGERGSPKFEPAARRRLVRAVETLEHRAHFRVQGFPLRALPPEIAKQSFHHSHVVGTVLVAREHE